jgi:hypothetical protein
VEFLNQAFGTGILTGGLNILLWFNYIIMLSLYAYAFGSYGSTLFAAGLQPLMKHVLISTVVAVFTGLNVLGSGAVGEAEEWIVGIKVGILLLFLVFGLGRVDMANLKPGTWAPAFRLITGGMVIFVAYEGFELIANTASDMKDPSRNIPRSYAIAVGFVVLLYILIAVVRLGVLSIPAIVQAKDYALAAAAKPFMGSLGFTIITIAALMSTASAINAANLRLFRPDPQTGASPAEHGVKPRVPDLLTLLLEQVQVLPVAFFGQVAHRNESQGGGVHAVAQARGSRPVLEHVPQMRIREPAANLRADHAEAPVGVNHDVARFQGPGEARPPGSRFVLVLGAEKRLSGHHVDVDALLVVVPVFVVEGTLRSVLLGHRELERGE